MENFCKIRIKLFVAVAMFLFTLLSCVNLAVVYAVDDTQNYIQLTFDYGEIYQDGYTETVYITNEQIPYLLPEPSLEGYVFAGWERQANDFYIGEEMLDCWTVSYNSALGEITLVAQWVEGDFEYNFEEEYIAYSFLCMDKKYIYRSLYCSNCGKEEASFYFKSDELCTAVENIEDGFTEEDLLTAKDAILTSISDNMVDITDAQSELVLAKANTLLDLITYDGEYSSCYDVRYLLYDVYIAGVDYIPVAVESEQLMQTIKDEYDYIISCGHYTADSLGELPYYYEDLMLSLSVVETAQDVAELELFWQDIKTTLQYIYVPSDEMSENIDAFLTDPTEENLQSAKEQLVNDVSLFIRACDGEAVSEVLAICSTRLDEIYLGDGASQSIADNLYSAYYEAIVSVEFEKTRQSLMLEVVQEFNEIYYSGMVSMQSLEEFAVAYNATILNLEQASSQSDLVLCGQDWSEAVEALKKLTLVSGDNYVYCEEGFLITNVLQISDTNIDFDGENNDIVMGSYSIDIIDENGETIVIDSAIKVGIKISDEANIYSAKIGYIDENGNTNYIDATIENGYITFYTDSFDDFTIVYKQTLPIYIYLAMIIALIGTLIGLFVAKNRFTKKHGEEGESVGK